MKQFKVLGALALAISVFAGPALAETQTIRVSGSLDARYIWRQNFDLRSSNDAAVVENGGTVPTINSSPTTETGTGDSAGIFHSVTQVEIAADLTDNVSVVVNLFNQRDWNANTLVTDDFAGGAADNAAGEFDVGIDLAYVELKEAFYAPLTLTIGRQDIEFGRGFVFGDWQIADPDNGLAYDEYSAVTSYDAIRATLDFNPWTVDFVWAMIEEGDVNDADDRDFLFANVNYQFSEYNAEAELYFGYDRDRNTNDSDTVATQSTMNVEKTYMVGTRGQFDPVDNLTVGAEWATQWGDYFGGATSASLERDREASAFNVFGEYRWTERAYTPWVGIEWVWFEGDDGTSTTADYTGWNGLFRSPTYGNIREWLETYYETGLAGDGAATTNHAHLSLSGGFEPMDDLSIDGTFYWFWTDEDITATNSGTSNQNVGDELGTELDVNVTYDYTEDVTFGLGLAWFFPGSIYEDATPIAAGNFDDTATQVVSSVSVAF